MLEREAIRTTPRSPRFLCGGGNPQRLVQKSAEGARDSRLTTVDEGRANANDASLGHHQRAQRKHQDWRV